MEVPTQERKTNRRRRGKRWVEDLQLARAEGSTAHIKRIALDRNMDPSCQDRRQSRSGRWADVVVGSPEDGHKLTVCIWFSSSESSSR